MERDILLIEWISLAQKFFKGVWCRITQSAIRIQSKLLIAGTPHQNQEPCGAVEHIRVYEANYAGTSIFPPLSFLYHCLKFFFLLFLSLSHSSSLSLSLRQSLSFSRAQKEKIVLCDTDTSCSKNMCQIYTWKCYDSKERKRYKKQLLIHLCRR